MSINLKEKNSLVYLIKKKISKTKTIIISEFRGLKSNDISQLRSTARSNNVYLKILKNSLVKRAIKHTIFDNLTSIIKGPLIYAMSKDATSAPKIINSFCSKNSNLVIKNGNYSGNLLDKFEILKLAKIPNKKILLEKLINTMKFPLIKLIFVLRAIKLKKSVKNK